MSRVFEHALAFSAGSCEVVELLESNEERGCLHSLRVPESEQDD